jgi:hypothetical protein
MSQTASQEKHNAGTECLYVAFELALRANMGETRESRKLVSRAGR